MPLTPITDAYGDVWTHRAYGIYVDGRGTGLPRDMIPAERYPGRAGYIAGFDHARDALTHNPTESAYVAAYRQAPEWEEHAEEFVSAFYGGVDAAIRAASQEN
jgi:hypothetical protein